ncbi:ABC transporter permease [Pseudomonas nitroreducens]|uniref:ABC transporter permease n=1 Tax=Pseudomonas TaxID=286 RepID=UPI000AACE38E|nr:MULTISPECIES: ABC transporter permease [Pseudomonas]MCJ1881950.1 ABC transporter permease [Pseudomonas nitroreducens]MCJ1895500.1 ABC transporter permease [Pseudomonas nitroreducens]MDH1072464.1 ABC transporter permease [Pseudomonas nitroreducens]NMZ72045.1 ABC transporter permease [Pseudomonas nitroreducens]
MSFQLGVGSGIWSVVQVSIERARLGLKSESTRTRLGLAWWVLEPLIMLGIYYMVFGQLLRIPVEDYAVFLIIGVTFWTWFSKSVLNCTDAIYEKKFILEHCTVDPLIFPLTSIFKDVVKESVVVALLLVLLCALGLRPTLVWLYLPLIAFVQLIITAGIGVFVAGLIPFMPDLRILISTGMQFLMFASGIFYTKDIVPGQFHTLFELNPLASLVNLYREVLMYDRAPPLEELFTLFSGGLAVFLVAALFVANNKNSYAMALSK